MIFTHYWLLVLMICLVTGVLMAVSTGPMAVSSLGISTGPIHLLHIRTVVDQPQQGPQIVLFFCHSWLLDIVRLLIARVRGGWGLRVLGCVG